MSPPPSLAPSPMQESRSVTIESPSSDTPRTHLPSPLLLHCSIQNHSENTNEKAPDGAVSFSSRVRERRFCTSQRIGWSGRRASAPQCRCRPGRSSGGGIGVGHEKSLLCERAPIVLSLILSHFIKKVKYFRKYAILLSLFL
jgi:hypothetical protein